jgi:hypothetical protein
LTATKKPASSPHTHWLAIRKEAEWWNAYYTCHENLLDAELIGAIQTQFVASPERKEAFRALMQEIVEDLIRQATGALPITESESET